MSPSIDKDKNTHKLKNRCFIKENSSSSNKSLAFKGLMDSATVSAGFNFLQDSPVVGPVVIDLVSMVIPRTAYDFTRGHAAGIETFRREVSSTVNAFILPGLYALGVGWLINAVSKNKAPNIAIDNASVDMLTSAWHKSGGDSQKYMEELLKNIRATNKVSSNPWTEFPKGRIKEFAAKAAGVIDNIPGSDIHKVEKELIELLGAEKGIEVNYKCLNGNAVKVSTSVGGFLKNATNMAQKVYKINPLNMLGKISEGIKSLNNKKALLGLGVATGIAGILQYTNRLLTEKETGTNAFVGLPNYEEIKNNKQNEPKNENHMGLWGAKIGSSALMTYLVGMSLVGNKNPVTIAKFFTKPAEVLKSLEFKGKLPTLNQMKALMGATFIGRFLAASDDNEMRESFFRDIFGYLNLLVIGGLVSSGTAYGLAKSKGLDLSYLFKGEKIPENKGFAGKLMHVLNNLSQKTHAETDATIKKLKLDEKTAKAIKGVSNKSALVGITYSILALGTFMPWFNDYLTRKVTAKKSKNTEPEKVSKLNEQEKSRKLYKKNFDKNLHLVEETLGSLNRNSRSNSSIVVSRDFLHKQFFTNRA